MGGHHGGGWGKKWSPGFPVVTGGAPNAARRGGSGRDGGRRSGVLEMPPAA